MAYLRCELSILMLGMMEGSMSDLIIATRDRRRVRLGEIGVLVTLGCTLGGSASSSFSSELSK